MARKMSTLERAELLKSARENGWEHCPMEEPDRVHLASARHHGHALVLPEENSYQWRLTFQGAPVSAELCRSFSAWGGPSSGFTVRGISNFGQLLHRAAELAFALPNHGETLFQKRFAEEILTAGLGQTEVERAIRQRVGQSIYRELLLDYWGGACAVTGIAVPEVLRASHAKPWADCASDAERLDVYNGLLLVANLDALFDRGLITFSPSGEIMVSSRLAPGLAAKMGCQPGASLRWLDAAHSPFLTWHRGKVWKA